MPLRHRLCWGSTSRRTGGRWTLCAGTAAHDGWDASSSPHPRVRAAGESCHRTRRTRRRRCVPAVHRCDRAPRHAPLPALCASVVLGALCVCMRALLCSGAPWLSAAAERGRRRCDGGIARAHARRTAAPRVDRSLAEATTYCLGLSLPLGEGALPCCYVFDAHVAHPATPRSPRWCAGMGRRLCLPAAVARRRTAGGDRRRVSPLQRRCDTRCGRADLPCDRRAGGAARGRKRSRLASKSRGI